MATVNFILKLLSNKFIKKVYRVNRQTRNYTILLKISLKPHLVNFIFLHLREAGSTGRSCIGITPDFLIYAFSCPQSQSGSEGSFTLKETVIPPMKTYRPRLPGHRNPVRPIAIPSASCPFSSAGRLPCHV